MKPVKMLIISVVLGGCAAGPGGFLGMGQSERAPQVADGNGQIHPRTRPGDTPADARTADEFDTTSAEERQRAVAEAAGSGGETALGITIASLGAVGEPGIWLKTPLVDAPAKGRVEYPEKGTAVAVDLVPLDAAPGAGSQISLAAMRLIEADLTALPELRVFRAD